jgi:hypothetical protein
MLKLLVVGFVAFIAVGAWAQTPLKKGPSLKKEVLMSQEELLGSGDWKGHPESSDLTLGVLGGWTGGTATPSFNLLGSLSAKVAREGFIPDINDTASLEFQAGPLWDNMGFTYFNMSTHLRWDFQKDETWTFYALGGVAFVTGHGPFNLFPRVGLGAMYDMSKSFVLRFEFSREILGVGVSVPLWF